MVIAIEHEINIQFDYVGGVFCEWIGNNYTATSQKAQTGRAVSEAFLLMDITL